MRQISISTQKGHRMKIIYDWVHCSACFFFVFSFSTINRRKLLSEKKIKCNSSGKAGVNNNKLRISHPQTVVVDFIEK